MDSRHTGTEPTPDLFTTLERIEAEAKSAREKFQRGELVNGRSALRRIEELSGDVIADVRERETA